MCMYDLKVWFSTGLVLLERKQKPDLSADPGPPNNSLYIRPKMNLFLSLHHFFDNNILKSKHMTQWLKKKKENQLSVVYRWGKRGGLFPFLGPLREFICSGILNGDFIIILNEF